MWVNVLYTFNMFVCLMLGSDTVTLSLFYEMPTTTPTVFSQINEWWLVFIVSLLCLRSEAIVLYIGLRWIGWEFHTFSNDMWTFFTIFFSPLSTGTTRKQSQMNVTYKLKVISTYRHKDLNHRHLNWEATVLPQVYRCSY